MVLEVRYFGFILGGMAALFPLTSQAYVAIIYFRNLETGDRNIIVNARPGDRISLNWEYSSSFNEKWKEMSVCMDIEGSSIITDAVGANILSYIQTFHNSPSKPYTVFTYGPGVLRDDKNNPGNPIKPIVCNDGIYFRFNIDPSKPEALHGITTIAQFTVPLTAKAGESITFDRVNWINPAGLATGFIDGNNQRGQIKFSTLVIVPEPSILVAIGLIGAGYLRRRRR